MGSPLWLHVQSVNVCLPEDKLGLQWPSFSFIAIGGTLFSFGLGADGIGPLAVAAGGGRALVYFEGGGIWVSGTFIVASIVFGLGLISQVLGILHTDILKSVMKVIICVGATVFVAACAIPSGWGLYAVAAAALLVYLPIGIVIRGE